MLKSAAALVAIILLGSSLAGCATTPRYSYTPARVYEPVTQEAPRYVEASQPAATYREPVQYVPQPQLRAGMLCPRRPGMPYRPGILVPDPYRPGHLICRSFQMRPMQPMMMRRPMPMPPRIIVVQRPPMAQPMPQPMPMYRPIPRPMPMGRMAFGRHR